MPSDEELMRRYMAGNVAAFQMLFDRYAPTLLRVMRQELHRPADAEDLVQQTFLQLHRARADYDPTQRLRPWLFTIAMNLKREYFRGHKRRPEAPAELSAEFEPQERPAGQQRVDAALSLQYALKQLPPDQREVIVLHWLADMPLSEVAELVGASLSAVKVRAHRGYAALRAALSDGNREQE